MGYMVKEVGPANILGWRARDHDGVVYDGRNVTFDSLPSGKLINLVVFLDRRTVDGGTGYRVIYNGSGNDWFFWDPDVGKFGRGHINSVIVAARPQAVIIRGSNIAEDALMRLTQYDNAWADQEF